MPATMNGYQVCVFGTAEDPRVLGDVLERDLHVPHLDAMHLAHGAPGVLPARMPEETAARLVERIRKLGLAAEPVCCGELPCLEAAEDVHHLRCTEQGLEIVGQHGVSERVLPWESIELIAVGQLPDDFSRHYLEEDLLLTAARRAPHGEVVVRVTPGPELWLICRNPIRSLRVHHGVMNYEYLSERMKESSTVNFRALVEDLVRFAPQAFLPPSTRAYRDGRFSRRFTFDSQEEFERQTLLQLLIHRRFERPTEGAFPASHSPHAEQSLYHCLHCGAVRASEPHIEIPNCCGQPMTLAAHKST